MGFSPRKTVREFATVEERYGAQVGVGFAPAITFLCTRCQRREVRRCRGLLPTHPPSQHHLTPGLAWPTSVLGASASGFRDLTPPDRGALAWRLAMVKRATSTVGTSMATPRPADHLSLRINKNRIGAQPLAER